MFAEILFLSARRLHFHKNSIKNKMAKRSSFLHSDKQSQGINACGDKSEYCSIHNLAHNFSIKYSNIQLDSLSVRLTACRLNSVYSKVDFASRSVNSTYSFTSLTSCRLKSAYTCLSTSTSRLKSASCKVDIASFRLKSACSNAYSASLKLEYVTISLYIRYIQFNFTYNTDINSFIK